MPMSVDPEPQPVIRCLVWAELVTTEVINGQAQPVYQKSHEIYNIAAFRPEEVHRRLARSMSKLVKDGQLL